MLLNITLLAAVQQLTSDMSCSLGMLARYQSNSYRHLKMSSSRTKERYLHGGEIWSEMAACYSHVRVANMEHNQWVSDSREKKRASLVF